MKIKADQLPTDVNELYTEWSLTDSIGDEWIVRRFKLTGKWEYESLNWNVEKEEWTSEKAKKEIVPKEITSTFLVS